MGRTDNLDALLRPPRSLKGLAGLSDADITTFYKFIRILLVPTVIYEVSACG